MPNDTESREPFLSERRVRGQIADLALQADRHLAVVARADLDIEAAEHRRRDAYSDADEALGAKAALEKVLELMLEDLRLAKQAAEAEKAAFMRQQEIDTAIRTAFERGVSAIPAPDAGGDEINF